MMTNPKTAPGAFHRVAVLLGLFMGTACAADSSGAATGALVGADDVSFVCATASLEGLPLTACPTDIGGDNSLYALTLQRQTGEVAVIRLRDCGPDTECINQASDLDLEPSQPGTSYLPVGSEPVNIASTPGGVASFVGVADPGREGIFALPTSCIGQASENDPVRDVRSWPACSLSAAPGPMEVIVVGEDCGGADYDVEDASYCPRDVTQELGPEGRRKLVVTLPARGEVVVVDVQSLLNRAPGSFDQCPIEQRLPLAVSLPAAGVEQSLPADLVPAHPACMSSRARPGFEWQDPGTSGTLVYPTLDQSFSATPVDLSVSEEQIFLADASAPVIHVLSFADSCELAEQQPLLPVSLTYPDIAVTTRRLAASPRTSLNERFIYAIDASETPHAGSVMVFDISDPDPPRAPLVREGSALINEPPDRIDFGRQASDVDFVAQDLPVSVGGVQISDVVCEPVDVSSTTLQQQLRTRVSPSRLRGVFGVVGLLSGDLVLVDVEDLDAACRRPILADEDDVVAQATPTQLGCPGGTDDRYRLEVGFERSCNVFRPHRLRLSSRFLTAVEGGSAPQLDAFPVLRRADGESLRVDQTSLGRDNPRMLAVLDENPDGEPEPISAPIGNVTRGVSAPPTVTDVDGLACEVVSTPVGAPLSIDPAESDRNSLRLPLVEPRAYESGASGFVTYEGVVMSGVNVSLEIVAAGDPLLEQIPGGGLRDQAYLEIIGGPNADFCLRGVEDELLTRERAERLMDDWADPQNPGDSKLEIVAQSVAEKIEAEGGDASLEQIREQLSLSARQERFATEYGDYVEFLGDFLTEDADYWSTGAGAECGATLTGDDQGLSGRPVCELFFGSSDLPDTAREFRVVRVLNERMIVEPREPIGPKNRRELISLAKCCFEGVARVRSRASRHWVLRTAGNIAHDVEVDPETRACVRSCNPLIAARDSRVYEVSCEGPGCLPIVPNTDVILVSTGDDADGVSCAPLETRERPAIGSAITRRGNDIQISPICVLTEHPRFGLKPGDAEFDVCAHQGLTSRFAVYRGLGPSSKDLEFSWTTTGQFVPLSVGLGGTTLPNRLHYLPEVERMFVADGGSDPLSWVSLRQTVTQVQSVNTATDVGN